MGSDFKVNKPEQPIIFFDGVCNLCNGAVQFIIKRDPLGKFKLAPLQSQVAQEFLTDDFSLDSIVLFVEGKTFVKSNAALIIAGELAFPWSLLKGFMIFPRSLRDWLYSIIAKNRYKWFGQSDVCMIPSPEIMDRFLPTD